jgi:hypothetical protein
MNITTPSRKVFGVSFFVTGILLGVLLAGALTWASLEATTYGFLPPEGDQFDGLICPELMTPHETGAIQLQVKNPSNKEIEPIMRTDISTRGVAETKQEQLTVPPGETRTLSYPINADNIDLGFFIFARAERFPSYPLPDAAATCGIFIVNLPLLNGMQLFSIWLGLSLVLIPIGLWMWSSSLLPQGAGRMVNAAKMLAVIVLASLWFAIQGSWLVGLLLLALTILLSLAMLRFVASK